MPSPITCLHCICYQRGYALVTTLCRELRLTKLCQKQVQRERGVLVVMVREFAEREG
jgi:hypothetical protein